MGTTYNVYAGPLARCKVQYEPSDQSGCVTRGCSKYHEPVYTGLFCQGCGKKLSIFKSTKQRSEKIDYTEIFGTREPLMSTLSPDGKSRIFTPNVERKPPREFLLDAVHELVDDTIVAPQIEAECLWFKRAFEKEITQLRDAYEDDNVTVEWCWISWTS